MRVTARHYAHTSALVCLRVTLRGHVFGVNLERKRPFVWTHHWTPEEAAHD